MSKKFTIEEIIRLASENRASDVHIVCGIPVRIRVDGALRNLDDNIMTSHDCESYARELSEDYERISKIGEQDLAVQFSHGTRCRVNLYRQQGSVSAAIRILGEKIPEFDQLGLPAEAAQFQNFRQGIVLLTGETGSGKSTTLACILNQINHTQLKHIITLEDPIEYVYRADKCVISQREIGADTCSYTDGLNAILREDPDVILIGEMRDRGTIETALTAAETGHLVFATLHTNSAADTIDRIVNVFPGEQQGQIRMQLSMSLRAVMCQQLLPRLNGGGRVLGSEIMIVNPAIRNLIREGKTPQIPNAITTSAAIGNHLMDTSLVELYRQKKITSETAVRNAHDSDFVKRACMW